MLIIFCLPKFAISWDFHLVLRYFLKKNGTVFEVRKCREPRPTSAQTTCQGEVYLGQCLTFLSRVKPQSSCPEGQALSNAIMIYHQNHCKLANFPGVVGCNTLRHSFVFTCSLSISNSSLLSSVFLSLSLSLALSLSVSLSVIILLQIFKYYGVYFVMCHIP